MSGQTAMATTGQALRGQSLTETVPAVVPEGAIQPPNLFPHAALENATQTPPGFDGLDHEAFAKQDVRTTLGGFSEHLKLLGGMPNEAGTQIGLNNFVPQGVVFDAQAFKTNKRLEEIRGGSQMEKSGGSLSGYSASRTPEEPATIIKAKTIEQLTQEAKAQAYRSKDKGTAKAGRLQTLAVHSNHAQNKKDTGLIGLLQRMVKDLAGEKKRATALEMYQKRQTSKAKGPVSPLEGSVGHKADMMAQMHEIEMKAPHELPMGE